MEDEPKDKQPNGQPEQVSDDNLVEKKDAIIEPVPQEKSPEEKISDYEYDGSLVKEDLLVVGLNFDSDLIVNGQLDWSMDDERAKKLIAKRRLSDSDIELARSDNQKKLELFKLYIDDFNGGLKHARVNPFGPMSPLSPAQAVKKNAEGIYEVTISPTFMEQMKYLKDRCPDISVVVPFYNEEKPEAEQSNVPETESEIDNYTQICEQLIIGLGSGDESSFGEGLTLEIGNETNVSNSTGGEFGGSAKDQFASEVDPTKYAEFYIKVATRLKTKYPNVKIAIAGTACYDNGYVDDVLSTIEQKTDGKTSSLVDSISYHPYGDFADDGAYSAADIEDGQFVDADLSFDEQHETMATLAEKFGIKLDIGEINFSSDDPNQREKLKKFLAQSKTKGVVTKLWPTASMPSAAPGV